MVNTRSQKTNIPILGSHANLLESLMNLCVSVIILLVSVKSKLSSPYNRVLRVKGTIFAADVAYNDYLLQMLRIGQYIMSIINSCSTYVAFTGNTHHAVDKRILCSHFFTDVDAQL